MQNRALLSQMLAGMPDDLYFQVCYGLGEVRYGPEGVDLTEFSSITKKITQSKRKDLDFNIQLAI